MVTPEPAKVKWGQTIYGDADAVQGLYGGYTFYYKKFSKEDLFMWLSMHENFILPHIRSVNFRVKFFEISDHMLKLQFYHIMSHWLTLIRKNVVKLKFQHVITNFKEFYPKIHWSNMW